MDRLLTYIISLPAHSENYAKVVAQLDGSIFDVQPSIGLAGRLLPNDVCRRITGDTNSIEHKGALGCMLSHIRVWEDIASLGVSHALILEDDVLASNSGQAQYLEYPANFDLLFCNDRTGENPATPHQANTAQQVRFADVSSAISRIDARGQSVGADAYIVSRKGAERLLALFNRDGYFGHVDVRMLAYSVSTNFLKEIESAGRVAEELRRVRHRVGNSEILEAYCCNIPLFIHPRWSQTRVRSRREIENVHGKSLYPRIAGPS